MASINIIGYINTVKYLKDSVIVFVDEYKSGYKKSDGTMVEEKYVSWKTIWKAYFKSYIAKHFGNGMLVEIRGDALPYSLENKKDEIDGYTVIGKCIDIFPYPRNTGKMEKKMIKESQDRASESPDVNGFMESDF